jgi:Uma2 family endonuclease
MARSKQRATYDDLLKLPDHLIGEIIDGELVASPRPGLRHSRAAMVLSQDLGGPFDRSTGGPGGPGGWYFLFEPELHLHGDVLVPDVVGWRRERMARAPDTAGVELAPDWVCEVLSPSTARYDRNGKRKIYEREKVGHLWLVDPANRTLEVFALRADGFGLLQVFGGDDKVRADPFAELELALARWWDSAS